MTHSKCYIIYTTHTNYTLQTMLVFLTPSSFRRSAFIILLSLQCNSLMHCTAVRAKASLHCAALPYLNTLNQCTPHTAVRPGNIEDTSPPPLSLSMTTSTTNLVASNHRAGKCDFQAHSAVERHEWSETRVDWFSQRLAHLDSNIMPNFVSKKFC